MPNKVKVVTSQLLSIIALTSFRILPEVHRIINKGKGLPLSIFHCWFSLPFFIHHPSITKQFNIQTYGHQTQITSIRNTVGGQEYRCSHNMCKDLL